MFSIQLPNGVIVDNFSLLWLIPLALLVLAMFQLLYIFFLRYAPTRAEPRPPEQPIMPAIYAPPAPQAQPSNQPVIQQMLPPQPMPVMQQQPIMPQPQVMPVVQQPVVQQRAPVPPAAAPARGNVSGMGKFVMISGLDSPKEIAIPAASFFIGRFYSPENSVLVGLDEKSISRKHAQFTGDEFVREYYLKDSNSSFGTYLLINGNFEQLSPDRQERVYNEDVVQFGNVVTVRLMLPCESRSAMTNL